METLDLLQEVLDEYQGTILLVSHDRDFLNKITTSMLYMRGDGTVIEHVGNYEELYEKYIARHNANNNSLVNKKEKPSAKTETSSNKSNRLTYKDQRLYEVLPQEIENIEQEIKKIEQALSDAELYTSDKDKFYALTEKLKTLQEEKDLKETKWLEIEMQINSTN
jgi:ATP-binding cassette subfamily F protein uup